MKLSSFGIALGGLALLVGAVGCAVAGAQQAGQGQQAKPPAGQAKPAPAGQARPQGQQAGKPQQGRQTQPASGKPQPPQRVRAAAGLPVEAIADPAASMKLAGTRTFTPRSDPFELLADEKEYEKQMLAQTLFQRGGTFPMMYVEPPERQQTFVNEPQPYRRLAAVLIGESISALIDMGDGKGLQRIRPGLQIPGTDWVVDSIDREKAVLRRIGTSNKRPTEVIVRLESRPANVGGGGQGALPGITQGEEPGGGGGAPAGRRGRGGRLGSGGGGNPD